jgi:hypothetical protein
MLQLKLEEIADIKWLQAERGFVLALTYHETEIVSDV